MVTIEYPRFSVREQHPHLKNLNPDMLGIYRRIWSSQLTYDAALKANYPSHIRIRASERGREIPNWLREGIASWHMVAVLAQVAPICNMNPSVARRISYYGWMGHFMYDGRWKPPCCLVPVSEHLAYTSILNFKFRGRSGLTQCNRCLPRICPHIRWGSVRNVEETYLKSAVVKY